MKHKISWKTASAIVIANMIGTGVFTSLGFQLVDIKNTWSILLLWILGAVMAVCGALTYAELGTKLKRSGGEYHFLTQTYSPLLGYLSGWASLTIGFAAPIALAAIAAGSYTERYLGIDSKAIAVVLILLVSFVHTHDLRRSSIFQNITTSFKLLVILFFILVGFWEPGSITTALDWSSGWKQEILLPSFAVSLIYVTYSYSGWNAAAYIIDDIKDVNRNLPIALLGGSILVGLLYVLLQVVFLKQAPLELLSGKIEIGQIVATQIFGDVGGKIISLLISIMLVSSISAMTWVGPRVTKAMADDYRLWSFLKKTNKNNIPSSAIGLQAIIAVIMVSTGTFDQILTYSGFILQLFVALTVFGLFFIRKKQHIKGFKSPLFPIPQIVFSVISLWILAFLIIEQPKESLIGILILLIGIFTYYFDTETINTNNPDPK
ncbi:APC family permease [Aquimarina gracilis]|uniref:APC family permease n=1 Tax=Aquimarina gracilis TaxID=874422 RepID=A0ABU5ZX54_9FLAO|nr:APC family permease [Aquimarina gracilis]MEB3346465.1 APC family permease [Aquimarina gracilis]